MSAAFAAAAIQIKLHELAEAGFDVGQPRGLLEEAGNAGFVRRFEKAHIYWHQATGAHEVHGAILEHYLARGGPGPNPATGQRELGYPETDELPSVRTSQVDVESPGMMARPTSSFEFGYISMVCSQKRLHPIVA